MNTTGVGEPTTYQISAQCQSYENVRSGICTSYIRHYLGRRFIAGALFEHTTLLSKSLDNTVLFFLCILVVKVEIVILS